MKLVKIGNTWYTAHKGALRGNREIAEDKTWAQLIQELDSWSSVRSVSQHEFDELMAEFGELAKGLHIDASLGSGASAPGSSLREVRQISLEDPTGPDKFDTYHAPVVVRQISLEDPTGPDKFDTYHAPVIGKKLPG